jgi:AcrR family transcriptional regulator
VSTPATRLPAAERRLAIVKAALGVFSRTSYSRATTAGIAREAGVSEPILYRHFASKRDLYFACLDEAWAELRAALDAKLAAMGEHDVVRAAGQTALGLRGVRVLPQNLWIQALTEAGGDPEIKRYIRRHMREIHGYVAEKMRRAQELGGIPPDRDAEAEAWIFIAGGLLLSVADRLGGVIDAATLSRIAAQRHRWLTGDT